MFMCGGAEVDRLTILMGCLPGSLLSSNRDTRLWKLSPIDTFIVAFMRHFINNVTLGVEVFKLVGIDLFQLRLMS